jgi:hypothetical protein
MTAGDLGFSAVRLFIGGDGESVIRVWVRWSCDE